MTKSPTLSTPSRPLSPVVRKHMAKIGAKGGAKRKNNEDRYILAREAARISWMPEARAKRLKKKIENNSKYLLTTAHPLCFTPFMSNQIEATKAGERTHETTCLAGIDAIDHECTCGNSSVTMPLSDDQTQIVRLAGNFNALD